MRSLHLALASLALAVTCAACSESPTSPSSVSASTKSGQGEVTAATGAPSSTTATAQGQGAQAGNTNGFSLRFTGSAAADDDGRVKVQIDPHVPADVGADFTIEFWMKADPAGNASASCQTGEDGWRYGNVILDRSLAVVPGQGSQGSYGLSLSGGRIAFGVSTERGSQTVCGLIDVADGRWHHVAATRRAGDGQLRVYVDGTESAQGHGPLGDVSYRNNRAPSSTADPFLLLGGAKPPAISASPMPNQMAAFSGWIDELRISTRVRYYAPFDRPLLPFVPDADTGVLYHFDEGPVGPCGSGVMDGSGHNVHGQCRVGGPTPGPAYDGDNPFMNAPRPTTKSWLQD